MRGRSRRIGHYVGGSDLEENWGSAGLKLCETIKRAQAVEERQRRLYADRNRRGVECGRSDRAGRRAHPRADARGVHPCIVVRGVLDLVRKGAAGGRPQHEEDGHGQRTGNRPKQRSEHWYALRTRNHLIYSEVTLSIPPLWALVRLASKRASPCLCPKESSLAPSRSRNLACSQRDERLQAILAEVEAEPDDDSERDLYEERIADSPVRADRATDVSGQKNRAQDRRRWNQIDHDARNLENRERQDQRLRQSQMSHPLHHLSSALQLHECAHQENERHQNRNPPTDPHDLSARCHHCMPPTSSRFSSAARIARAGAPLVP